MTDLEKAREIKSFLEQNYQEAYSYEDLSTQFHINQFKLKHAFKQVAGDTIHVFLTKVRIAKAQELLLQTDESVITIAASVGLEKSNFNIQFKRIAGMTPIEWKKDQFSQMLKQIATK
jgi:AraC-like DNA-binding protein